MFFPSHLFTPFLSQKVALSYNWKKKKNFNTELLKKNQHMKRNIGLEWSFLSKIAHFLSNFKCLSSTWSCCLALGMRLLGYSLHCLGQLGESLLNFLTFEDPSNRVCCCFVGLCAGIILPSGSTCWIKLQLSYNLGAWVSILGQLDGAWWTVFMFLCPEVTIETEPTCSLFCFSLDLQQTDGMVTMPWSRTLISASISIEILPSPVSSFQLSLTHRTSTQKDPNSYFTQSPSTLGNGSAYGWNFFS